jgi:TrmH family RNA methyltransferase
MNDSLQGKFSFILVRPEQLGNIGSVARVMKNFGLSDLRLVEAPRNYKDAEARKMAVGAFDLLKMSTNFNNLADAIGDLHFVIGTSSGQQRKQAILPIDAILGQSALSGKENKIGIAFGEERNGLRNDELEQCHVIATIPTNLEFPSLNLAQAACIVGYEISKRFQLISAMLESEDTSSNGEPELRANALEANLPSVSEVEQLFDLVATLMDITDFSRSFNKAQVTAEIRRFYQRAMPTKRECDLLRGMLHKLNQSIRQSS